MPPWAEGRRHAATVTGSHHEPPRAASSRADRRSIHPLDATPATPPPVSDPAATPDFAHITLAQRRRLRQLWRSAGWPCHDTVEVELLAAGLVSQAWDEQGRLNLRVTDLGLQALTLTVQRNRRAFDAHEALVARVAEQMQRAGRLVWCGLSLRAPLLLDVPTATPATTASDAAAASAPAPVVAPDIGPTGTSTGAAQSTAASHGSSSGRPGDASATTPDLLAGAWPDGAELAPPPPATPAHRWAMAMPDVFSIRQTSVEDYVEPAVHEIKVSRADLQSDLRKPDKGRAYLALASQCWYVLKAGIADTDEIPPEFGVVFAHADHLELARAAPRRAMRLSFGHWMVLARATPLPPVDEPAQGWLGDPADPAD
ncbi:MAG: hypothetical protein RL375_1753 [Pseudomonadota bacterium]